MCCFVCLVCYQLLWIVHCWLPLRCSLTCIQKCLCRYSLNKWRLNSVFSLHTTLLPCIICKIVSTLYLSISILYFNTLTGYSINATLYVVLWERCKQQNIHEISKRNHETKYNGISHSSKNKYIPDEFFIWLFQ